MATQKQGMTATTRAARSKETLRRTSMDDPTYQTKLNRAVKATRRERLVKGRVK